MTLYGESPGFDSQKTHISLMDFKNGNLIITNYRNHNVKRKQTYSGSLVVMFSSLQYFKPEKQKHSAAKNRGN